PAARLVGGRHGRRPAHPPRNGQEPAPPGSRPARAEARASPSGGLTMIDELTRERLGRELRSAARQIRLEPGSELTVVKSGRKRRRRRNRLTALTAVAALGAGTV